MIDEKELTSGRNHQPHLRTILPEGPSIVPSVPVILEKATAKRLL